MGINIKNYVRNYDLESGNIARSILFTLAFICIIGGIILAKAASSAILFIPYLVGAVLIFLSGYVIGYIIDVQTSKLELLELLTEKMLSINAGTETPTKPIKSTKSVASTSPDNITELAEPTDSVKSESQNHERQYPIKSDTKDSGQQSGVVRRR
ncbi:MAG TPA: hypothetical protein VFD00_00485 [Thermoclostridium sp.]|nr:hypothetical protein [Thermoclostridium sp.]